MARPRTTRTPYRTELDWLDHEMQWVEARLQRLKAQACLTNQATGRRSHYDEPMSPQDVNRLVALRARFSNAGRLARHDLVAIDLGSSALWPDDMLGATLRLTGAAFNHIVGDARLDDAFLEFSRVEAPLADMDSVVLAALFTGEPGTGKTLCAHAVAGELGRPMLEASVSSLLSKWVGDSERNLAALFRQAREHGSVLFLDECDAILRERGQDSAPHDDRLVNVFLRLLERHDGLVLLATNREETLDRALSRRVAYRVTFPMPDATDRAAIWSGLLPDTVPTDGTVDPVALGRRYALTGGRIRNAVFKAAFRAASHPGGMMTGALLEAAAAEEFAAAGGNGKARVGFATEVA